MAYVICKSVNPLWVKKPSLYTMRQIKVIEGNPKGAQYFDLSLSVMIIDSGIEHSIFYSLNVVIIDSGIEHSQDVHHTNQSLQAIRRRRAFLFNLSPSVMIIDSGIEHWQDVHNTHESLQAIRRSVPPFAYKAFSSLCNTLPSLPESLLNKLQQHQSNTTAHDKPKGEKFSPLHNQVYPADDSRIPCTG